MSDGRGGVLTSRRWSGAARFRFGPSFGFGVEATKEIVAASVASIPDDDSGAFAFARGAGEEEEFLFETPSCQRESWGRPGAGDGDASEGAGGRG